MTRIVSVIGGKGGIGKTTLVSNLSSSLAELGYNVVAMDANMTTPNLGLHLGLHLSPKTLHHVLKGHSKLANAMYNHPNGFKIVPGSMSVKDLEGVDIGKLPSAVLGLYGKSDFVIRDSAAGLGREALSSIKAADEILLLTNPDMPSVVDALKTAKIADDFDKKVLGVVLNKSSGGWHDMSDRDIERTLGHKIVAKIPHDGNVPKSIALRMPVTSFMPHSPASVEFRRLAHTMVGKEFKYRSPSNMRLFDKLVGWLTR
jgi:septum site-determining protein MinD